MQIKCVFLFSWIMAFAVSFELSSCLGSRSLSAARDGGGRVWEPQLPDNQMWMNCLQDLDGLRESPPLTVLLRAFQNECMKIWSLLRSGKFSCHTNRQPIRGPDGRRDLNKCLMCQRLLWVSAPRSPGPARAVCSYPANQWTQQCFVSLEDVE